MRLNAIAILLLLTSLILLASCSSAPPPSPLPAAPPAPDIEATVEAKVKAVLTAVPTATPPPEITVVYVATPDPAEMESSAADKSPTKEPMYDPATTPGPEPTPLPPVTPTPTPLPTPTLVLTWTPVPTSTSTPPVTNVPETSLDKETALKYFESNELELAIENINRHIKLYPRDTSSYVMRGLAHAGLKKFRDALDDFNIVLTLPSISTDPDEVRDEKGSTFQIIAYLYWELGLLQDSFNNLDNLLHVDEKTITASEFAINSETQKTIKWLIDGINYLNAGLYGKAIESFTEFIDCTWAGKPPAWGSVPEGCTERNYNVFITWQGGSEHPIGYFHRGVAYKELGDLQKATSDFTKVIELDPDNSRGFSRKATDSMTK